MINCIHSSITFDTFSFFYLSLTLEHFDSSLSVMFILGYLGKEGQSFKV